MSSRIVAALIIGIGAIIAAISFTAIQYQSENQESSARHSPTPSDTLQPIRFPPATAPQESPSPSPTREPSGQVQGISTTQAAPQNKELSSTPETTITPSSEPSTTSSNANLSEPEAKLFSFIQRVIDAHNKGFGAMSMQNLNDCIIDLGVASQNIDVCLGNAKQGLSLMTYLENQTDAIIREGPLEIPGSTRLSKQTIDQGHYLHSPEFRDYINSGKFMFKAAEQLFEGLDRDHFTKKTDERTAEDNAKIQDQLPELENLQKVTHEALKKFVKIELEL